MRVSKERAAQNREKILASAARLFRERGIGATGVDSITADAGLTHGGLYSQFGSKEAIAAEAIRFALARSKGVWQRTAQRTGGKQALRAIVAAYLSTAHRDSPGHGCVVASLGSDIARQPRRVRQAFTRALKDELEFLSRLIGNGDSHGSEAAIVAFASMAGALILARAVNDATLSDRILRTTARWVLERTEVAPANRSSQRRSRRIVLGS